MIFGPSLHECYRADLEVLCKAIGPLKGFSAHVVHVPVDPSPEVARLARSRRTGEKGVGEEVRAAMIGARLYTPGWPKAERVGASQAW